MSEIILNDVQKKEFAEEIMDYLQKRDLFFEVNIYTGKEHFSDDPGKNREKRTTEKNTVYYAEEYNGCPCEYNNPDTLTMTFEGPLYHEMNEGSWDSPKCAYHALNKIAEKYGLYHEMGYAWSLAFYS